jgi:chemotaxis protein methyltransferase CheR
VNALQIHDNEVEQLLTELSRTYGYDFTSYAQASLKRRISRLLVIDRIPSFAELLYKVKHDPNYLSHLVEELTVNVTEMFRDPHMWKVLKEAVFPKLDSYPFVRIWHAGCSTGEEVYSMAIFLEEAGLLQKSLIYATDLNPSVLNNIRKGIFPIAQMKQYSENYLMAGGTKDFSSYYTAQYQWAIFDERLKKKMIVATHNLVSDRSFNEFQLILCRNVLIYFDKPLQDHVLSLFDESLESLGYLILGSKENIRFSPIVSRYKQIVSKEKIWRKNS